jgi:hypothetical protein
VRERARTAPLRLISAVALILEINLALLIGKESNASNVIVDERVRTAVDYVMTTDGLVFT